MPVMKKLLLFSFATLFLSFVSCKKEEGLGGQATIKGKVHVTEYNNSGVATGRKYYAGDFDVYIIYGEGSNMYDDFVRTSFDGSFEFRYLRPGSYRVFVYSKNVSPSATEPFSEVMQTVDITDKKQVIELEDFEIND